MKLSNCSNADIAKSKNSHKLVQQKPEDKEEIIVVQKNDTYNSIIKREFGLISDYKDDVDYFKNGLKRNNNLKNDKVTEGQKLIVPKRLTYFLDRNKVYSPECFKGADGEIGNFKQGNTGDCWILAGIKALGESEKGKQIIKNNMFKNKDGSTTVVFRGLPAGKNAPTVSESEFNSEQNKKLSEGDADVKIIEIATRKVLIANKKMAGNPFRPVLQEKLEGGDSAAFIEYFTGIKSETTSVGYLGLLGNFKNKYLFNYNDKKATALLDKAGNNNNFAMTVGSPIFTKNGSKKQDKTEDLANVEEHVYTVKSVDKNQKKVTMLNPHDTSKSFTLSYDEFLSKFGKISLAVLN